jgi:DNA mismatch repair protein MutS2
MKNFLERKEEAMPHLAPLALGLYASPNLERRLLDSIEPGGDLRDAASAELGTLRRKRAGAATRITETIQKYTQGRFRDLLSDPIYTIRDGRYVVPLKSENRGKIRGIVHDTSASGQTIFLEPEEVVQLGNSLREVEGLIRAEEFRILSVLAEWVGKEAAPIRTAIETSADIDLAFACARYGFGYRGVLPELGSGGAYFSATHARHPLLDPDTVVPLTIEIAPGKSVLITGPNTGGKTVAIKCVGLLVAMAQSGMLLPALTVRLMPFAQIWADIGDEQSLQQSLSTFSGHIKNVGRALRELKPGALVLLDEVGAGTDPAEGAALAASILRALHRGGAAVLASTHYGELKAFAYNEVGYTNAAMEFDERTLRPTYRLIMGAPGASQALRIAERYGIASELIEEAKVALGTQAAELATMLDQLAVAQKQARIAQGEADRRLNEAKRAERGAEQMLREAEEIKRKAHANASEVIESALREIRLEAGKLFDELKAKPEDERSRDSVRRQLKELDEVGRDFAREFQKSAPPRKTTDSEPIRKGDAVTVAGFGQKGTVLEDPKSGQVPVQIGMVKLTVPLSKLQKSSPVLASNRRTTEIRLQKGIQTSREIDLRHARVEDALPKLERFVDDALLAGSPSIRILHGKGEGILRKVTQAFLSKHPDVTSFRDGEPAEGGQGVTIVEFE